MSTVLPRRIKVAQNVLAQPLPDGGLLLDLQSELYFSLDNIGFRIWELFNEHDLVEEVILHLLNEYDITEPLLRVDVADLLTQWQKSGLISIRR